MTDKITIERETLQEAVYAMENATMYDDADFAALDALKGALRAALAAQPAEPAEQVACKGIPRKGCNYLAYADTVCNKCGEVHHHHQMLAHFYAAPPAPAAVPPGMALVPIEPTPGIITTGTVALMKASDSDLDATREEIAATYRAMIAAVGDKP